MKDIFPKMREIQAEEGQIFVHPFDDPVIIAGHGTLGLELLDDGPTPDVVIVPIGGGGLISGVAAAIKLSNPHVRIIGVEPEGAPSLTVALEAGRVVPLEKIDTIADGLAAPFAGEYTLPHVQAFVDEVVLVNDEEIAQAMRLIMERCKVVPEPAAATSFAALYFKRADIPKGSNVISVLSGGNVDLSLFKRIF
jgi:threonine dehydratase